MQTEERRKILIVDDDPMVLKVIRSYLKDRYKVYCIRSGEEALKFFSMQIPDVVLLDYMMPGMDGPEVFRRMAWDGMRMLGWHRNGMRKHWKHFL